MDLAQQILWYALWLGVVFGVAEGLRSRQVEGELVRKVIHIGVGNIILLAWFLAVPRWLGIGFSVVFSLVALLSYQVKILQSLNGVARKSFGTFFYALSIALLLTFFWWPGLRPFAVIGVLVMTWGDAIAALVGQAWGRHPYQVLGNTKSWEGSGAMWGVSSVVIATIVTVSGLALSPGVVVGVAVGVAAIATGLEVFSWRGLDNLTVPLASGGLTYGVALWLGWL